MVIIALLRTNSLTKLLRKPLQSKNIARSYRFYHNNCYNKMYSTSISESYNKNEDHSRKQVIVLAGATSAGKSAVALELTKVFDSEIVIGDSVQVYKHADIGSNKPTIEEQNLVRHHLVDIIDSTVDRNMSSGEYVRLATVAIYDILSRGKTPIVVGGSTMWLEWLIHGVPDAPKATEEIISHVKVLLADYIDRSAWEEALLKCRVMFRDPTRADKLSTNDWYRLSRYLEVELTTNKTTIGSTQDLSSESSSLVEPSSEKTTSFSRNSTLTGLDVRCFFLSEEREELYRIIDTRCLDMLDRGLFEETTSLILDKHLEPDSMVARAIGYRQAIKYLCNPNRKMEEGTELEEFIK